MRKLFLLILIIGLTTAVSLAASAEPFGTNLGSFNGVVAYSNDYSGYVSNQSNYYGGDYTGMKWQCVEFSRRYYRQHYDYYLDETVGYAQECFSTWGANAEIGQHTNGSSTTPPAVGDIICASGGGTGHVAVVRSVSANTVTVIQQNFTNSYSDASFTLTLTQSGGHYTVGNFSASYPVQGWLSYDELDDWINITSPAEGEVWRKGQNYAIEWDDVPGVSTVLIHLYKYVGGTWQMYIPVQNSWPDNGHYYPFNPGDEWEEGQIYQIRMANVGGTPSYGESGTFYVAGDLIMTAPTSNMSPFHPGDEIPVTWDRTGMNCDNPIDAVRLDLQYSTNGGGTWGQYSPIDFNAPNSGSYSGVIVYDWNTSYDYRIAISNSGSPWLPQGMVWDYSEVFTIVSIPQPPDLSQPSNGATGVSTSPTFQWNASQNATSYTLQVDDNSNFSSPVFNQNVGNVTNRQVTGLSSGTTYYWRVMAHGAGGDSQWSSVWSFTTQTPAPNTPTLQNPANGATGVSTSPTMQWNSSQHATSYTLQVDDNSNFSSPVFNQNVGNVTNRQVTGLSSGTTYYWRVMAHGAGGDSQWSSVWSFTTQIPVPDQPTLSSPQNGGTGVPTSPLLVWNAAAHATSYSLLLDDDSNFNSPLFDENVGDVTSQQINDLELSTTYYWKVRAHNGTGDSPWSDTWSFTTVSPDPFIIVTSPNGGEVWTLGEEQTITWSDNFDENVKIELYLGDTLQEVVADYTESDGEHLWTPSMLPVSSDYKIEISKVGELAVNDISDEPFTIQPQGPDLTFTMTPYTTGVPPNGGWVYYAVSLTNNGGPLMGLTYWTNVTLPNGNEYPDEPEHYGPFNLPEGFDNPSIQRQFSVPAMAPEGEYTYIGKIGYYPDDVIVTDSFTFVKMANGALGTGGDFDWPTQYGQSLEPDLAGETGQDIRVEMPSEYEVSIYPNPFNPTLTASISMPEQGELNVRIFGIDGRLVAELAQGSFERGRHQLVFDGTELASGVYFIQATVPGKMNVVRKAILLR